ncbi:hypothetical protein LCGC14_3067410 [marine sediment metagenome]|uniref:Type III pantothenate kinase n=1 Tax=marine sediment metagenome TaxID=412755 RepID=A0A0F8WH02_9ZZZZ|nr:type III pantothenate kinase [Leeuwenhoekiella sp.]
MKNLAIDIGNTRLKLGVFQHQKLIFKEEKEVLKSIQVLEKVLDSHTFQNILLASTGNPEKVVTLLEQRGLLYKILDHKTPVPFKNSYKSPETLGVDRMALVAAATKHYPEQDVLVIDAGTCVTYDFKNKNEEYLGGSISLGLSMRFKALHHFTAKLPLLEASKIPEYIGKNTAEAIESGVIHGILTEIKGVIDWYRSIYPELTIILTGGDALFLSKTLKNGIFAHQNFLLEGLDYIMVFNTTQ